MTTRTPPARGLWFLVLGFAVWASALTVLYAALSVGCELGWDGAMLGPVSVLRPMLLLLWAAHLAVLAWLYLLCRRLASEGWFGRTPPARFLVRAGLGATAAAFVATFVTGIAVPGATMCT